MAWSSLLVIFISVVLNASAMLCLKAGARHLGVISFTSGWMDSVVKMAFQPYILAGIACYGISLVVWVAVISKEAVSSAYPITALVYVINALAAGYLFGETLRSSQWMGMACILLGVLLMARS
jgi:drug/metabolite transporter (DMT)-like permease